MKKKLLRYCDTKITIAIDYLNRKIERYAATMKEVSLKGHKKSLEILVGVTNPPIFQVFHLTTRRTTDLSTSLT